MPPHIKINNPLLSLLIKHIEEVMIRNIPTKNIRIRLVLINFFVFEFIM